MSSAGLMHWRQALLAWNLLFLLDFTSFSVASSANGLLADIQLQPVSSPGMGAIRAFESLELRAKQSGEALAIARAAFGLGKSFERKGMLGEASLAFERALSFLPLDAAPSERIRFLLQRAVLIPPVISEEAGVAKALAYCSEANALAEQTGQTIDVIRGELCFGQVLYESERTVLAKNHAERVLELSLQDYATEERAEALALLADIAVIATDYQLARQFYERAAADWKALGEIDPLAEIEFGIALLLRSSGNYTKAEQAITASLESFLASGNQNGIGAAFNALGQIYYDTGHYRRSMVYMQRSFEALKLAGREALLCDAHWAIGRAALALGDGSGALASFRSSAELALKTGYQRIAAYALEYEARAHLLLGNTTQAQESIQRALKLDVTTKDPLLQEALLSVEAAIAAANYEHRVAIDKYREALSIAENSGELTSISRDELGLATALFYTGDLGAAENLIEVATNRANEVGQQINNADLRRRYYGSVHDLFRLQVDIDMRKHHQDPTGGHYIDALKADDSSRARSLLQAMASVGLESEESVIPGAREDVANTLEAGYSKLESAAREMLVDQDELAPTEADGYRQSAFVGRSKGGTDSAAKGHSSLRAIQSALPEDTLVLQYALGDVESYRWSISSSSVEVSTLPPRRELERQVRDFKSRLLDRSGSRGFSSQDRAKARSLADILLPKEQRSNTVRLVLVTAGALNYLPFEALILNIDGDENWVGDRFEVVRAPSLGVLKALMDEVSIAADHQPMLVLADAIYSAQDPRLPHPASSTFDTMDSEFGRLNWSAVEAESIDQLATADVLTGFEANTAALNQQDMSRRAVVHFATHARVDPKEPGRTGLVLSRYDRSGNFVNSLFGLREIYRLELDTELVVLSACETALGEGIPGEGLVGLSHAFLYAGSKRVVASMWAVPDAATSVLMREFYSALTLRRLSPAAALKSARQQLQRSRRWRHPHYWSGFVLVGDWRRLPSGVPQPRKL
ncbi:MAG: CHAT domain-containing protein [Pseudomonadota bacterium]